MSDMLAVVPNLHVIIRFERPHADDEDIDESFQSVGGSNC